MNFRALWVEESEPRRFTRRVIERDTSDLPPGELLVRVEYSSLNYKDALSASGAPGVTRRYPHTPGIDAVGVVEESLDESIRPGERVLVAAAEMGVNVPGGFGQYVRVPAQWVLRLPRQMSPRHAMSWGTAGYTAALCVERLLQEGILPGPNEVLVTGASGGVGSTAVALLAHLGCRVTAVTGKPQAEPLLRALGAEQVLPREAVDDSSDKPLLHGRWAGVVDTVGGSLLASAIRATRPGGVVTACGNAASPLLSLTVYPFILRGVTLAGIDATRTSISGRRRTWRKLAGKWQVDLEPLVREVGLEDLGGEIDAMLRGQSLGRVIVRLSEVKS